MFPNNQDGQNQGWQPPQPVAPPTPPQQTSGYAPLSPDQQSTTPMAQPISQPQPAKPQPAQPTLPTQNPVHLSPNLQSAPQPLQNYTQQPANYSPLPDNFSPAQTGGGSEYLSQISPKKSAKGGLFSGKMLVLVGALIVALLAFGAYSIFGKDSGPGRDVETLAARLTSFQELLAYGQANDIGSPEARQVIAEASPILTSRQAELSEALSKYNFAKPSKDVLANESLAQVITTLDAAKNSNQLDTAYIKALRNKITSTKELINSIYLNVSKQSTRDTLQQTYNDLTELESRLPAET